MKLVQFHIGLMVDIDGDCKHSYNDAWTTEYKKVSIFDRTDHLAFWLTRTDGSIDELTAFKNSNGLVFGHYMNNTYINYFTLN